jgi:hypothetical protein
MYVLRIVNKNRWRVDDPSYTRSAELDAPAHTLLDLGARGNELSVWVVDSSISRLPRLTTALAANCNSLDALDYILFNFIILDQVGIQHQFSPGDTPDAEVNGWHLALLNLTAMQVASLAVAIWHSPLTKVERQLAQPLKQSIIEAIDKGDFRLTDLKEEMQKKITQKR